MSVFTAQLTWVITQGLFLIWVLSTDKNAYLECRWAFNSSGLPWEEVFAKTWVRRICQLLYDQLSRADVDLSITRLLLLCPVPPMYPERPITLSCSHSKCGLTNCSAQNPGTSPGRFTLHVSGCTINVDRVTPMLFCSEITLTWARVIWRESFKWTFLDYL